MAHLNKSIRILLILLIIQNLSYAQKAKEQSTDYSEKKFVRWFFKNDEGVLHTNTLYKTPPLIIYTDALYKGILPEIRKALTKDTIFNEVGVIDLNTKNDFLVFTESERLYINDKLDKMNSKIWSEGLLKNSKVVNRDAIDSLLEDRVYGWSNFNKKYGPGFYSFSKPIFIRNSTICIFYNDYSCPHTCGYGDLAVYKKEKNKWKKWLILYKWIS